ncbi:urease accessory protein UreF [Halobacillus halophilus]|uniref:Urease accessory protein UreF n=1 Tax=Halobacillus halophilus (strain ATCC 35676 / DSM 2266 / JCM 20832 / KCTC 3685 / LMG 17431 / NBRC 102448 / NCIMB 2269) TaxID=866895 RepID=I0JR92_HALH3|nr:urease accessory protein UreF [Halobacillus halophilus]ASF40648.1 urease accessory protein UreF [Halobacillus halophilus]CCG46662.1 urease accessory protein UreF [Halobacillus halophilus DSM 2266]
MINGLMPLLQLSDSQFPSGAFSHSFGFETYIQEDVVKGTESFKQALIIFLKKQLIFNDGLACRLAYESMERGSPEDLMDIDHVLFATCVARETREGNRKMGERLAKLCMELYPSPDLSEYLSWIKKKEAYGHPAVVLAVVYHSLDIPKDSALETFLFTNLSSLVQNAVRGIPMGQTAGQKILLVLQPYVIEAVESILGLSPDDLGAGSPGLEIAQMHHERLNVRLFMS